MDKQEFATLAIAIKSAYPASKVLEDAASMDFWYAMLKDIDYKVAENAVAEHICTNIFPPNIAEIRKLCMERCKQPVLSFDEAWGVVQKALSTYGRNNPQRAYDTMDELTLQIVKNLGWTNLCTGENQEASRANFRMAYEEKAKAAQNRNQIPDFLARNKEVLKKQYIPVIEPVQNQRIEYKTYEGDIRENLTKEQLEERSRRFEEARRQILGGKETKSGSRDTGN